MLRVRPSGSRDGWTQWQQHRWSTEVAPFYHCDPLNLELYYVYSNYSPKLLLHPRPRNGDRTILLGVPAFKHPLETLTFSTSTIVFQWVHWNSDSVSSLTDSVSLCSIFCSLSKMIFPVRRKRLCTRFFTQAAWEAKGETYTWAKSIFSTMHVLIETVPGVAQ